MKSHQMAQFLSLTTISAELVHRAVVALGPPKSHWSHEQHLAYVELVDVLCQINKERMAILKQYAKPGRKK